MVCLTILLGVTSGSFGQDHTGRLDQLFEQLQHSQSRSETDFIEQQIIRLWSDSGSVRVNWLFTLAKRDAEAGHFKASLNRLEGILLQAPEFAEAWNLRATILYLQDDLSASVRNIERCLALNPRHFGALNGLGLILEKAGQDDLALAAYRKVAELSPNRQGIMSAIERIENRIRLDSY